jgi:hypothetical protein
LSVWRLFFFQPLLSKRLYFPVIYTPDEKGTEKEGGVLWVNGTQQSGPEGGWD